MPIGDTLKLKDIREIEENFTQALEAQENSNEREDNIIPFPTPTIAREINNERKSETETFDFDFDDPNL